MVSLGLVTCNYAEFAVISIGNTYNMVTTAHWYKVLPCTLVWCSSIVTPPGNRNSIRTENIHSLVLTQCKEYTSNGSKWRALACPSWGVCAKLRSLSPGRTWRSAVPRRCPARAWFWVQYRSAALTDICAAFASVHSPPVLSHKAASPFPLSAPLLSAAS